jgi:hypothetical protein
MIKEEYLKELEKSIEGSIKNKKVGVFLFGSSLREKKFGDLDLGLVGDEVNANLVDKLEEILFDSTFPYVVDVVDFNKVSEDFKNNVFSKKILWIKKF